jgi:hypothetical protein
VEESSFSDEDPSIDKDIDERYLVPCKPQHPSANHGGGMSAKKQKDNQELKKSMISTENQSCQFEEVQTNMSLDYQVSGGGATFAEGNQLRQGPPSSYPAGAVRHQVAK